MFVISTYLVFGVVGLIIFITAYFIHKYGKVKLLTRNKLIFFVLVIGVSFLSRFVYQGCTKEYQNKIYLLLHHNFIPYVVFAIIFLLIIASWIKGSLLNKQQSKLHKFSVGVGIIFLLLILLIIGYLVILPPYSGIGGGAAHIAAGPDRQRRYDLDSLQRSLENYFEDNNSYPASLEELAEEEYLTEEKGVDLFTDPITEEQYEYISVDNGNDFVLRVRLGVYFTDTCFQKHYLGPIAREMSQSLFDLDGLVHGLACDDPFYCLSSEKTMLEYYNF